MSFSNNNNGSANMGGSRPSNEDTPSGTKRKESDGPSPSSVPKRTRYRFPTISDGEDDEEVAPQPAAENAGFEAEAMDIDEEREEDGAHGDNEHENQSNEANMDEDSDSDGVKPSNGGNEHEIQSTEVNMDEDNDSARAKPSNTGKVARAYHNKLFINCEKATQKWRERIVDEIQRLTGREDIMELLPDHIRHQIGLGALDLSSALLQRMWELASLARDVGTIRGMVNMALAMRSIDRMDEKLGDEDMVFAVRLAREADDRRRAQPEMPSGGTAGAPPTSTRASTARNGLGDHATPAAGTDSTPTPEQAATSGPSIVAPSSLSATEANPTPSGNELPPDQRASTQATKTVANGAHATATATDNDVPGQPGMFIPIDYTRLDTIEDREGFMQHAATLTGHAMLTVALRTWSRYGVTEKQEQDSKTDSKGPKPEGKQ